MGIRPGKCYRQHSRPYTRQSLRRPRKGYVKGVPKSKIVDFQTGNSSKPYSKVLYLRADKSVQIRDNSLESARVVVSQLLEKNLGLGNYFFRIRPYPHQVIRENPMATGAGADRFQTGMRQSFGNPIGSAARVFAGQIIMEIFTDDSKLRAAKSALNSARYKLPTTCSITVEDRKQ